MRKFVIVVTLAAVAGLSLGTLAVRLRAARAQLPSTAKSKHVAPLGSPPPAIPPFDRGSVTFAPQLEASGEVLPGRRVHVHARADLDAKPRAIPELFTWRIALLRESRKSVWDTVWAWNYDRPIDVRPGTHTRPEIEETVGMPPGEYLVQVSLVPSEWEETEIGPQLVHTGDTGGVLLRSFWAIVK
jgi:hypothetical protein